MVVETPIGGEVTHLITICPRFSLDWLSKAIRKPLVALLATITAFFLALTACTPESTQRIVSEALGIDASSGAEVSTYDSHGGNGDGTSCIALACNDEAVVGQIEQDARRSALPLDDTVQTLVYGIKTETTEVDPSVTDELGDPLVPKIQNGYHLLIDRQEDQKKDILRRSSYNLTVGIYDTDSDTLYCCELDT